MLKKILSLPQFYLLSQGLFGFLAAREKMLKDYGQIQDGQRILDIGCGPGFIVRYLGKVQEYLGFDISQKYISYAQKKYGADRIHFRCELFTAPVAAQIGNFDLVLLNGLIHHLTDKETVELLHLIKSVLKPTGRVLTLDGCYTDHQNKFELWLMKNDRGGFVRTKEAYSGLSSSVFTNVRAHSRKDYLKIPYTLLVQELSL